MKWYSIGRMVNRLNQEVVSLAPNSAILYRSRAQEFANTNDFEQGVRVV